jgi:hypothetical protein
MSRWKLKVAERLLKGHTNLRIHTFKLGLTQRQDCKLCGEKKEDSVHLHSVLGKSACTWATVQRLRWSVASGTKDRGFKPGRSMTSFALSQLCGRLNNPTMRWESHLTSHLSPIISPFANRGLSRRLT